PAGAVPELPDLEMALLPRSHRYVSKKWQDCNWVQALEGSIDTAHEAGGAIAGGRRGSRDDKHRRHGEFLMPIHSYAPSAMPGETIFGQTFVPFTDTNCWIFTYAWNPERPLTQAERDAFDRGNGVIAEVENYVPLRNKSNNYLIDRKLQK